MKLTKEFMAMDIARFINNSEKDPIRCVEAIKEFEKDENCSDLLDAVIDELKRKDK